MLLEHGIRISMDGKGRYIDNIFVERLWRSVKYEEVYLKAYQNVPEARAGIGAYLRFYNHERPHQALGYQTPQEIFEEGQGWRCLHEQGLALPSNLETTSPVMVPTKPAEDSLNLALSLSKQWGPLQSASDSSPNNSPSVFMGGSGGNGLGIKAWYPSTCFRYCPARVECCSFGYTSFIPLDHGRLLIGGRYLSTLTLTTHQFTCLIKVCWGFTLITSIVLKIFFNNEGNTQ